MTSVKASAQYKVLVSKSMARALIYLRLVVTRSILPDPSRADLPIRGRIPQSVQNMYLPGVYRGMTRVYRGVQECTGV